MINENDDPKRWHVHLVDLYARLKGHYTNLPISERRIEDVDGKSVLAILARPEFLPEVWQNRVISQNSKSEEDLAPLQTYASTDCFLEHPKHKEEDCKKVLPHFKVIIFILF